MYRWLGIGSLAMVTIAALASAQGCDDESETQPSSASGQGAAAGSGGEPAGGQGGAGATGGQGGGDGGSGGEAGQGGSGGAANVCKAQGGLCTQTAECDDAGGTVDPAGAPGCVFDDGPGVCCVPPAPQTSGDTCASHGGVCSPIAGCNFVDGAFAPPECTGVGIVCCVPETICGVENVICCDPGPSADFRPMCDRGDWTCDAFTGTTLMPEEDCT